MPRAESRGKTPMTKYYFYIARCQDNSLYIGYTADINKRIERHNKGQGSQWIKQHGPAQIIYKEEYKTRIEAMKREIQIKKWSRIKKENLIHKQIKP